MNEPLSPAAQAVKDATQELYGSRMARKMAWPLDLPVVAAALVAAADQVAPSDAMDPRNYIPMAIECQRIRAELLAIAAELEGHQ